MRWGDWNHRRPVDRERPIHTCDVCGRQGLAWSQVSGKYKLLNPDMTPHQCNENDRMQHAAADFEDPDQ